jgi:hypothetical protein
MRAVSAALVLMSGAILMLTATAPTLPGERSFGIAAFGFFIVLVGLGCWVTAFVRDKPRD